jgi:hypothetical protein
MIGHRLYLGVMASFLMTILGLPIEGSEKLVLGSIVGVAGVLVHLIFKADALIEMISRRVMAKVLEELFKDPEMREFLAKRYARK